MKRSPLRTLCCVAGVVLMTAVSCSSPHGTRAQTDTAGQARDDASTVHTFTSISALKQSSTLVVEATVGPAKHNVAADADGRSKQKALAQQLQILSVLSHKNGSGRPLTLYLHELNGLDDQPTNGLVLTQGTRYILFLTPFTFGPGYPATGQYVVVGSAQGAYQVVGSTARQIDRTNTHLPAAISLTALRSQVSAK